MSRTTGTFTFAANFETAIAAPLDARGSVTLKSDLTGSTISTAFPYKGMLVSVTNDTVNNGLYILNNTPSTTIGNWKMFNIGSVWTGGTISISGGGTGQVTKSAAFDALSPMTTVGDIIYGGTSGTGTRLAAGSSSQILIGGASAPSWGQVTNNMISGGTIDLTTKVKGILPPAKGGTGVANGTNNTITFSGNYTLGITLSGNTTITLPTTGTLATLAGSESLTNKTIGSSSTWNGNVITTTYGGIGLSSYTAGDLPYYSSGTAFTKLGIGTVNQFISSTGSAPQWTSLSTDGTLSGNSDTTISSQKAIKTYVDTVAQGLSAKPSVRVTSTSNITLSGAQTIDGVSAIAGNRVLVQGQSTGSQNGIYLVASGSWTRATDMAAGSAAAGSYVFVEEGTTNADCGFVCNDFLKM